MRDTGALNKVLDRACRVRVTDGGASAGRPMSADVVIDETDPVALDALRAALTVRALPGGMCMCAGGTAFEFFDSRNREVAVVGLHHGLSVRWSGWHGDAILADGQALLRWLDERGAHGPLRTFEEDVRRRDEGRRATEDWIQAIPPALSELADQMLEVSQSAVIPAALVEEVGTRLQTAVPDTTTRTLALLAWFGSGTGRCSGYPVHEEIPGRLLQVVPIAEIIAALLDPRADGRHDAGAVRHLVGWKSRDKQKQDIATIPLNLKVRLMGNALAGADSDKLSRAEHWLG